ncbi:MAG: hypothetical protein ABI193_21275, partial [Minicystis sp.]
MTHPRPAHHHVTPVLAAAIAATATLGCLAPGKYNRLQFVYQTDDSLFGRESVKHPVALGAEVDLLVFGSR